MCPAPRTDIRDRVAGSASAAGAHASAEAVEGALAALGREAGLVLIFTTGDVDPGASAREAQEAAGNAHVAGMTGTGAIDEHGLLRTGCAAIAFSSSLLIGVAAGEGVPRKAGHDAAEKALAEIEDALHAVLLLFVDSESGDQAAFVDGAYAVAGGRIPLAGGAGGGIVRAQFADGRALSSGVVAVGIGSRAPIGVGVAHGCFPRGAPSIVTRSDGPNIIQLDGRPADAVYLEKLGVDGADLGDEEFEALAMVHPLAEPELSGALRPRYVRARGPGGVLVCATSIEQNAAVTVCDQTPDTSSRARTPRSRTRSVSSRGRPRPPSSSTAPHAALGFEDRWVRRSPNASWTRSLRGSAETPRLSPASTPAARSAGAGARKETATTVSLLLRSAPPTDAYAQDELLRRFVEAARRAQIVTIVNCAETEQELGELLTPELCEAFEAEIAVVLAGWDGEPLSVGGAYGLRPEEAEGLPEQDLLHRAAEAPLRDEGFDLLSVGARAFVAAPFRGRAVHGLIGVARLYGQSFDEAEAALLEAVATSVGHALERLRLGEERDQLYRDAHERGKAARVIGAIADGVLLVDDARIVRLWNPAAEAITGLPADVVLGRPLEDAIPAWSAIADSLVVANDRASSPVRATAVPLDIAGRELWLSIRGVGFAEGSVYAFHDLTEEHRLEQLKADFIATVSHELRTPLAAVHGAAKTLQRDDLALGGEVFQRLLTVISEQSDRLAAMVNNILLASRVDSPELEVATEHVDVAALAAEVVAAERASAGERLTLELIAPLSLPPVAADRERLRQVLTNLVANAAKYSPGGGRIQVELKPQDGKLAIVVRDTGLGIATAEQSLIFEKFYRADANMTRGVSGSGLGLYISRELVHRMNGTISVDSELGEGSTFVVTLPLAPPASRAD